MPQPQLDPFPDAELLLVAGLTAPLQAVFSTARLVTILPGTISQPTVRVKRISGANRDIALDRPIMDVDTFWTDYGVTSSIARQVTMCLLALRGQVLMNMGVISQVNVVQGPRWLPDPDPNLYRFNATYEMYTHGL